MSLVFKTIQTEGIAELSYLVCEDDEGVAAVFDPRADCGFGNQIEDRHESDVSDQTSKIRRIEDLQAALAVRRDRV